MTASYLTTDIIVIIVLIVVLILIGLCAFFTHFYWTKIGVAEIWNTAKWSSMRSSFYQTMRRFSRTSSGKPASERPFSAASIFSDESNSTTLPAPLRNNKSIVTRNPTVPPSQTQPSTRGKKSTPTNPNSRRNSSNQVQPVSVISYNQSGKTNYGTKMRQPLESTRIHNVHEYDERSSDPSVVIRSQRL